MWCRLPPPREGLAPFAIPRGTVSLLRSTRFHRQLRDRNRQVKPDRGPQLPVFLFDMEGLLRLERRSSANPVDSRPRTAEPPRSARAACAALRGNSRHRPGFRHARAAVGQSSRPAPRERTSRCDGPRMGVVIPPRNTPPNASQNSPRLLQPSVPRSMILPSPADRLQSHPSRGIFVVPCVLRGDFAPEHATEPCGAWRCETLDTCTLARARHER